MPARILASNVPLTAPLASPSFKISGPKAEGACTVVFTAPLSTSATLSGSIETSPNGSAWTVQQNFEMLGGPSRTGGTNHPSIAQGLAQYDGLNIRMTVTSVTGSGWIADSVILDW